MPIGPENIGRRMLEAMGWTEGAGLGPPGAQGRTEPIDVVSTMPHATAVAGGRELALRPGNGHNRPRAAARGRAFRPGVGYRQCT